MASARFGVALAAWAACAAEAQAGAWVAPEGGQEITTTVHSRDGTRSELFTEAPVLDELSLVGVLREGESLEAEIGAKWLSYRDETQAFALQSGAVWTMPDLGQVCAEWGHEVRALYGVNSPDGRLFLNLEGAVRRIGSCPAHRFEISAGWRPAQGWLGLSQVFSHRSRDGRIYTSGQLSVVRFDEKGRGLQLGVRLGDDGEAPAFVVAVWNIFNRSAE